MKHKKSQKILSLIRNSRNILVNCHEDPDLDSLASASSLYQVLIKMGKEVRIVSPDGIAKELKFLPFCEKVEPADFSKLDFDDFDLFIVVDTASWKRVTGQEKVKKPNIDIVTIDHHETNTNFGEINLVDSKMSSTCELLFYIFNDWGVKIDKSLANTLFAGIMADTDTFRYRSATVDTLKTAARLMELGAEKQKIVFSYYRMLNPLVVRFVGEILARFEVDREAKFVWAAIPYKIIKKYKGAEVGKDLALDNFARSIRDTNFALLMTERSPKMLHVSLRAREKVDVSKIATALGGGGHKGAAGAKVEGLEYDVAVAKVLEKVREYAKTY